MNDETGIEDAHKIMMATLTVTLIKMMMMMIPNVVHLSLLLPDTLHPHILWRPEVCLLFSNRGGGATRVVGVRFRKICISVSLKLFRWQNYEKGFKDYLDRKEGSKTTSLQENYLTT